MIKLKDITYAVLIIIICTIPFLLSKALLSASTHILGNPSLDNPAMYYFFEYFSGQQWRQGNIPLWNPYTMLGQPFISEGQAAIFHPMQILFALLPTPLAYNLTVYLAFISSAIILYFYFRVLKISHLSCFLSALVWNFSTIFVSRIYAGHLTNIIIFPLFPLMLLLFELWRENKPQFWVLPAISLTYGLMILCAHPQFLYIFSLFFLLYEGSIYLAGLSNKSLFSDTAIKLLKLSSALLVGVGIGSVYLLPAYDFIPDSFRAKVTYDFATSFSFAPENLLTILCPKCFGSAPTPGADYYWGRNYFWEMWMYIGIVPLLAVVVGLTTAPFKNGARVFIIGTLFLLLALGKNQPAFAVFYEFLPFLDYLRGPAKFSFITLFCLVYFAANGFEYIFTNSPPYSKKAIVLPVVVFALLIVLSSSVSVFLGNNSDTWSKIIAWVNTHKESYLPPIDAQNISQLTAASSAFLENLSKTQLLLSCSLLTYVLLLLKKKKVYFKAALIIMAVLELSWFNLGFWPTFSEKITNYPVDLQSFKRSDQFPVRIFENLSYPNVAMKSQYSSIRGYSGNASVRLNNYINRVKNLPLTTSQAAVFSIPITQQILGLSLDYVLVPDRATVEGQQQIKIRRPSPPTPRYYIAEAVVTAKSQDEALEYMLTHSSDIYKTSIVEDLSSVPVPAPIASDENIIVINYSPNKMELKVKTSQERLIVISEMYDKGWKASVNGIQARVFPTNYLFRGLIVPAGESDVVLRFLPDSFVIGRYVSLASLGAVVVIFLLGLKSKTRIQ